ncbi:hypothetical protein [Mucilaginibacter sp.]|uniref:hypothetical protein n=1 Tax=Mucilaginibacter sp. TaxID=1882438 RepID=UPI002ED44940
MKVSFLIDPKAPGGGRPDGFLDIAGGIDVTKVVQALADFLSDRIKQELTIAYLDKLKKAFASNPAISSLLPNTYEAFKDNDLFNLPSLGPTFKGAFAKDLAQLPDNFITYISVLVCAASKWE